MGAIAKTTFLAAAVAAALTAPAGPAAAQDIYSLQARVMQLEARVRELTTFKPVPPPSQGGEALSQRIRALELLAAEQQNALKAVQAEIEALKKQPR